MIMRIMGFDLDISFGNSNDNLLVVNNHKLFSKIAMCINSYTNNIDNNEIIFIGDNDEIIKASNVVIITELIMYDIGTKQILNKIYSNIKNSIMIDGERENMIISSLSNVNSIVLDELDEYNIDFDYDLDINLEGYLKLLSIKINNNYESLYDKVLDFIELYSELYYDKCIIIINTLCYFSDKEIIELFKYKRFKKLNILFIENEFDRNVICNKYIIDNDFYAYKE